jgi:replicative DNA helicase
MERELFYIDSEKSVLSAMCIDREKLNFGIENLKERDFSSSQSKIIYNTHLEIYKSDSVPSYEKTLLALRANGGLEMVGGIATANLYLTQYSFDIDNLEYHCNIIKELSILRDIENCINKITCELDQKVKMRGTQLLEYSRELFHSIADVMDGSLGIDFRKDFDEKSSDELKTRVDEFQENKNLALLNGLATYQGLDEIIDGLGKSQLIILAARPGMGKTALAVEIASKLTNLGNPVCFFSIEMAYNEIKERVMASLSGINAKKIRNGDLKPAELGAVVSAARQIKENKFIINDKTGITLNEVISKARRAKEKYNVSAIFIDYLQYIKLDRAFTHRHLEVGEITSSLKSLAKELEIPVFCLAQVSRSVDTKIDHVPTLSDLKESGSIEADADVVIFMVRQDFYDPYNRPGEVTLAVAKNRRGATGMVQMQFEKETGRFKALSNRTNY